MAPKDIRAFFGATGNAKPASKPAGAKPQESALQPKKPEKQVTPKKSPAKAPKKAPVSKKVNSNTKAVKPTGKASKASKKRKLVIDSDSEFEDEDEDASEEEDEYEDDEDDDVESMDEDSPKAGNGKGGKGSAAKGKSGKGSKKENIIDVSDDEDDLEVIPPPKKRQASESAKAAPARAFPSSLTPIKDEKKKPAARKSAGASTGGKKKTAAQQLEESLSESAKKAVAAVDKAAKSLPSDKELLESEQVTKMSADVGGWGGAGGADKMPENHGKVEHPRGHPDCLSKVTIVISGVLDSMMRNEATDYIKRHGGRVTSGVTGKTTFLLCGKDTGNSKFTNAKEKKTKLLTEQGLLALVKASAPFIEDAADEPADADEGMQVDPPKLAAGASSSKPGSSRAGPSHTASAAKPRDTGEEHVDPNSQLWVDKWKPKVASDLVGNPQGQTIIRTWLQDWDRVHNHGEAPRAAPGAGGQRKDMSKKALLVSGAPGIGKTTSAHIISKELGFEVVEVNASDSRNKSDTKYKQGVAGKLSNRVKELVTNTAISLGGVADTKPRRQVLIMDEVDGMSGGDRGGVSDLIDSIKSSKMPIICVCNDKYKQSLKSLKNHCLEIDWRKPTKLQAAARLKKITQTEGLTINQAAMDALVESSQGDMRVIIGQLQMHRVRAKALSYDDVKASAIKDMDKSPFECARQLLSIESANWSMSDRMDGVFQDMDLVPLLAQENYLNHKPSMAQNENQMMQIIAKCADAFSAGDVINKRVRMKQQWSLMPSATILSTVYPAAYIRGPRVTYNPGEMNFPRFTAWMGSNSSHNKQKRLLAEINTKLLAAGVVCNRQNLRLQYMPTLRQALTAPIAKNGQDGIDDVISLMQSYLINREDFDTILDITKCKTKAGWGADPMQGVESKTKAAFTRSFNKSGLPVRCTIMVEDGKKSKGKKAAAPVDTGDDALGGEIAEAAAVNTKDEDDGEDKPTEEDIRKMQGVSFVGKAPAGKGKGGKAAAGKGAASKGSKGGAGRGGAGRGAGRGKAGRGRGK